MSTNRKWSSKRRRYNKKSKS